MFFTFTIDHFTVVCSVTWPLKLEVTLLGRRYYAWSDHYRQLFAGYVVCSRPMKGRIMHPMLNYSSWRKTLTWLHFKSLKYRLRQLAGFQPWSFLCSVWWVCWWWMCAVLVEHGKVDTWKFNVNMKIISHLWIDKVEWNILFSVHSISIRVDKTNHFSIAKYFPCLYWYQL